MSIAEKVLDQNRAFINKAAQPYFCDKDGKQIKKGKKSFSRAPFIKESINQVVSAQGILIEMIMKEHGANPYNSADEVMGDLQMVSCEIMNYFRLKVSDQKFKPYEIEDFMDNGRFLKKSCIAEGKIKKREGLFCDNCEAGTRCSCVCVNG